VKAEGSTTDNKKEAGEKTQEQSHRAVMEIGSRRSKSISKKETTLASSIALFSHPQLSHILAPDARRKVLTVNQH